MHKARPSYEYGEKLLKQMGWSEGKGLGKNEDGVAEFIKVKKKMNTKGMGFNGVDDRWIEHQEDFDSLLSDLNDGNPAAREQKLISVEQRAFKVGGRVHYSKFLRGKDLSQKKQEELDAIVVKRRRKDVETVPEDAETGQGQPMSGVQTHTSNMSYQEYFAERMKSSRRRRGFGEDQHEESCQQAEKAVEYIDSGSADVKSRKKHERRSKRHCTGNGGTCEQYHLGTDIDNLQTNGTEPVEDCAEQVVPRRTKKSKHKPSQDSSDNDQVEVSSERPGDGNVVARVLDETLTPPAENCRSVEDTPKRAKKKSKHKPSQCASDGTPEDSSEQVEERGVVFEASGQAFFTPAENHSEKVAARRQKRKLRDKSSQDEVDADHLEATTEQLEHENWASGAFAETVALAVDSCDGKRARKKSKRNRASVVELPGTAEADGVEMGNRTLEGEQPESCSELPKLVKKKSKQKPSQDAVMPDTPGASCSATKKCTPQQTKPKQKAFRKVVGEEGGDLEDANEAAHEVATVPADLCSEEHASRKKKRKEKVTADVQTVEVEEAQIEPEVKAKKKSKQAQKVEVDSAEAEPEQAEPVLVSKKKLEKKDKKGVKTSVSSDEPEMCIPEASHPSSLPGNQKNAQKRSSPFSECQDDDNEPLKKKRAVADSAKHSQLVTRRAASLALVKEEISSIPESKPVVKKIVKEGVKKAEESADLSKGSTPSKNPRKATFIKKETGSVPETETKPAVKTAVKKIVKKAKGSTEVSQCATPSKEPCKAMLVKEEAVCKPESTPPAKKLVKETVAKGNETVEASKKPCEETLNVQAPNCSPLTNASDQKNTQKKENVVDSAEPFNANGVVTMETRGDEADKPADKPVDKPAGEVDKPTCNQPPPPSDRKNNNRGHVLKEIELQLWHRHNHMVFRPGLEMPEVSRDLASQFSEWFVNMVDKSVGNKLNPSKTCHLSKYEFAEVLTEHIRCQHRYSNWIQIPGYGTDEWLHQAVGLMARQMRLEARAKNLETASETTITQADSKKEV